MQWNKRASSAISKKLWFSWEALRRGSKERCDGAWKAEAARWRWRASARATSTPAACRVAAQRRAQRDEGEEPPEPFRRLRLEWGDCGSRQFKTGHTIGRLR